jgi:hypothetical protein
VKQGDIYEGEVQVFPAQNPEPATALKPLASVAQPK